MSGEFLGAYLQRLAESLGNDFADNHDVRRFGAPEPPWRDPSRFWRRAARRLLNVRGWYSVAEIRRVLADGAALVESDLEACSRLYRRLADEESKDLLLRLLAYRALGHRRVRLPTHDPERWSMLERIEDLARGAEAMDLGFLHFRAQRMHLGSLGYDLELFATPTTVLHQFVLQQYRAVTSSGAIEARPGDVVIDGGACYGDTALYFAHRVGAEGRVHSFEFLPENLAVLRRNLSLNPDLARRISIVEAPLWSSTGESLYFEGSGPATRVSAAPASAVSRRVSTVSIDDYASANGLRAVDLVKMDIEGSEPAALAGAEAVLRRFRPQLAICVYHSLSDFWTIPQYLDDLDLGYRFWLRHFTIHREETVLFASTRT